LRPPLMSNVRPQMHKLSHLAGADWSPHSYAAVFSIGSTTGTPRLIAGAPGGNVEPFEHLVLSLAPPYFLLYVLHTTRGEGDAGRYQSPALPAEQFRSFIEKFKGYLSADARFDLWAYSPAEQATVVWDRHNQLFAYGPLERFEAELRALGFSQGTSSVPSPHQHHYRPEFDPQAKALLSDLPWSYSPLKPEDEQ
jgi:hypothetical protein